MRYNANKAKPKAEKKPASLQPVTPKKTKKPSKGIEPAKTKIQEPDLSADKLAILFICQRGHQSLISILQGVNSTRVPVGMPPIKEEKLRALLKELENEGYLSKTEIHDQTTWIATPKARDLES